MATCGRTKTSGLERTKALAQRAFLSPLYLEEGGGEAARSGLGYTLRLQHKDGSRTGRWLVAVCLAALLMGLSGCTYNPLLGKWKIDQRAKETDVTYVDPLSSHIRKHTGNDTIEFGKNAVVVSGGPKTATEEGIHYQVTELEGAAGTEVKIYQPRKDDPNNYDIDVSRVAPDGKSAHLETPSEVVELKRIE